jgi:hypothetical protein
MDLTHCKNLQILPDSGKVNSLLHQLIFPDPNVSNQKHEWSLDDAEMFNLASFTDDLTWDSARGKDDEALADELAREWDLERLQAENFSPFSGTYLGHLETEDSNALD